MSTVSSSSGRSNAVGVVASEHSQLASTDCSVVDTTIVGVADEIWSELVVASLGENPASVSSYYNDMIKNDNKSDFKLPSELTLDEYTKIPPKLTWNINVKYSKFSINMVSSEAPICLCYLLIITAYKLKVFGKDAFGKVASRCKAAAAVINYLLEQNRVFTLFHPVANVSLHVSEVSVMKHSRGQFLILLNVWWIQTFSTIMLEMVIFLQEYLGLAYLLVL
jgi:hypothetical protein